ncbi:MAG: alkaline phosphatase family protein [Epsilonproteobacteria bacterium]|nr:alkaline phosphatase family protein [Campylobacterota bacterium]
MIKKILHICALLFALLCCKLVAGLPEPRVVMVIVVDQLAYHYIDKLEHFFNDGIKLMRNKGINYERAFFDYGAPSTAPGHATLATGTLPKNHGIILNSWIRDDGKHIKCAHDEHDGAAVYKTVSSFYDKCRSARQLMADTLSDQLVMASNDDVQHQAIALSLKDRAAINMAGTKGKAIWMDFVGSRFTSSKAYFELFPAWLEQFNTSINLAHRIDFEWILRYPRSHYAYQFSHLHNYDYCAISQPIAGQGKVIFDEVLQHRKTHKAADPNADTDYEENGKNGDSPHKNTGTSLLCKTPEGNQILIDLAKLCIDQHLKTNNNGKLLLWVSLSSLDMLGHDYGPHSAEVLDMIYQLDRQLGNLMRYAQRRVGRKSVVMAMTADHGVGPLPEVSQDMGLDLAHRIMAPDLVKGMNDVIEQKYGLKEIVSFFKTHQFYLNKKVFDSLEAQEQKKILKTLKKHLKQQPGIANAWTYADLDEHDNPAFDKTMLYKNQLYPNRSGDLICMPAPYCLPSKHSTGTGHRTPYDYDRHVPLCLYGHGLGKPGSKIMQTVSTTQLAPTLAKLLRISAPSACVDPALPGF